jgi:hypothetical protein
LVRRAIPLIVIAGLDNNGAGGVSASMSTGEGQHAPQHAIATYEMVVQSGADVQCDQCHEKEREKAMQHEHAIGRRAISPADRRQGAMVGSGHG